MGGILFVAIVSANMDKGVASVGFVTTSEKNSKPDWLFEADPEVKFYSGDASLSYLV